MTAVIIFLILALLLITRMPVAIAPKLFTGIEKFEIMAIPFFVLAGNYLTHGGVARRMIRFASSMVGHWYGGMGLAAVVACALFAAISGSSPATVMAVGSILVPAMVKQGYPPQFGVGTVATPGGLGSLIPPAIVMVMCSVATSGMMVTGTDGQPVMSASIGDLFIAGVVPGLVLTTMLGVTTTWRASAKAGPHSAKASGATC